MSKLSKVWFVANIYKIRILILVLLLYLFFPLFILGILVLQLIRKCVEIWAKIRIKQVDTIMSPESALVADDDLYGIPSNTVALFVLNGQVTVDNLRRLMYENIISKQNAAGKLLYPQLQQFPVRCCKFMFWVWDEDFNIEAHVRLHRVVSDTDENKVWNETDILKLQANLLRKQWMRNKSLWELELVPNYSTSARTSSTRQLKTVMLIRFHESLGDIASWFRLFLTSLCDNEEGHSLSNHHHSSSPSSSTPHKSEEKVRGTYINTTGIMWRCIYERFRTTLVLPLYFARALLQPSEEDNHCWRVEEKELVKRDHFKIIDKFSVQHIKDIKLLLGVNFTSVILAATASAIRTTLLTLGQVPKSILVELPTMTKACQCDIRDNICTYRSPISIRLPIGVASSKERLRLCQEFYSKSKQSREATCHGMIRHFLGFFPITWIKPIQRKLKCSGTLLNLPCTTEYFSMFSSPVEDVIVASTKENGFTITFLSYADFIRMSLVIDHRLIPANRDNVAKNLLKNFYSDLIVLGIEVVV